MRHRTALLTALLALLALNAVGVAGYMVISGMSFIDALWMTVITLTTVGYREVHDLDTAGRLFTIGLLVGGLGIVFYSATLVARDVIEGEIQHTLGRRRVQRQIAHVADHYIVCGFGRMGRIVCKELSAKPADFVVVEHGAEGVRSAEEAQYLCIAGDATEDSVLLEAGIKRARGLVAALSTDSDNVYVVLTARELNSDLLIVARAEDERSERKLLHAGASRVVSPYVIGGHRMAHSLLRPAVLDVIDLATHYQSIELQIEEVALARGGFAEGVTLRELAIAESANIIVVALKRANGEMLFNPPLDARMHVGDRLVLIGQPSSLREIEQRLQGTSA